MRIFNAKFKPFKWFFNLFTRKKPHPAIKLAEEVEKSAELIKELEKETTARQTKGQRPSKGRVKKQRARGVWLRNGEKIDHTTVKNSSGNYNTRINPINRHSKYGFALRRAQKQNRNPGRVTIPGHGLPIFLTDQ